MGETTGISWTNHTFNPWVGCTKVSPGCAHCYAETQDHRWGHDRWGKGKPRSRTSALNWAKPLLWNRKARADGVRRRVFCASLADVFDEEVPLEWLSDLAVLIDQTPCLYWLLLTKRPENFERWAMLNDETKPPVWPRNVWLGVTVENQEQAERRIPLLLQQDAAVRFLSCEPLLERLDLSYWFDEDKNGFLWRDGRAVQWVIVGGESGPKARPFELNWARDLVRECREGGVAPFVKQLGYRASDPENGLAGAGLVVPSDAAALISRRLTDGHGADLAEWPADLRVQEFPQANGGAA